jgi:YidC/Oxa1 family membrane protein insertase
MNQKTLTGFLLIGAILLLWPSYNSLINPEEKNALESPTVRSLEVQETVDTVNNASLNQGITIEEQLVTIKNNLYTAVISSQNGGSIASFKLNEHLKRDESSLELIDSYNSNNLYISYYDINGEEVLLNGNWYYQDTKQDFLLDDKNTTATLVFSKELNGSTISKTLTFYYNQYNIDIDAGLQGLRPYTLDSQYSLTWEGGLISSEGSQDLMFQEGLVGQSGNIESFRAGRSGFFGSSNISSEKESKQFTGNSDFLGYRTKYFGVFLVPQKTDIVSLTKYGVNERAAVDLRFSQNINFTKTTLFFGPLEFTAIKELGVGIEEKILGWQWLYSISWIVYSVMAWMFGLIPNYGVVVILFAILIKSITYPLMAKQLRSSKKMQEISPLLNQIKIKYKNNPTLQQQKMAALFQEHKINPLAGCLPILIQMPVLMAVFMVFRNTIEFRGQPFMFWINDLSSADTLFTVGTLSINVLPFLMAGSMYYTMKMSSGSMAPSADPAQEATQKMMKYMFPGMMFFLFYSFPSGLNLYYFCFNVLQIVQQKLINKEK